MQDEHPALFPSVFKFSFLTLPKREENDRLDGAELEDRLEGSEELFSSKVEEIQSIQGQTDGDVVDDCGIQVAPIHTVAKQRMHQL